MASHVVAMIPFPEFNFYSLASHFIQYSEKVFCFFFFFFNLDDDTPAVFN